MEGRFDRVEVKYALNTVRGVDCELAVIDVRLRSRVVGARHDTGGLRGLNIATYIGCCQIRNRILTIF